MRVVFLGTGEIGVPTLKALAATAFHEIQAVFTQPDRPAGRDLKMRPSPVKVAAQELGLPVFQPEKIRTPEALAELRALAPDVIVVAAYGQILPKAVLSLPSFGCINIHASLLPRHRGASPIQAAILEGDTESGITIMQMDEGLDTGDMLFQVAIPIGSDETAGTLHDRLAELAPGALLACLDLIGRGEAQRQGQDDALATYAPKLARSDGEIAWNESAEQIERRIRAMTPWPGAYTFVTLGDARKILKIHRAKICEASGEPAGTVVAADDGGILVAAGRDGIVLQDIQIAGGKRLAAAEFLRGHPIALGAQLGNAG
ncbi:MAG TPA: methionyl-tRNA formyltransferase [Terrimicrobiaceae bacterium]